MAEVFRINDIEYECEFTITNADSPPIKLTKSAIRGMTLVDNIFDPFASGTVSIANPYNFLEKDFFIRGDGRDEMKIMFKIKDTSPTQYNKPYEYVFSIVDEMDMVNPEVRTENIKTLTLLDKNALPFSDKIPYGKKYSGFVGEIIKEIVTELLGADKIYNERWSTGDFELFDYIPPATYRYIDLIRHLLRLFYAKDGDLYVKALMGYDYEAKQFTLELLSNIFKKNKLNLLEAFVVGDSSDEIRVNNPNHPYAEAPISKYFGAVKNLGYSTPQYGWSTDYFINSLVFGYNKFLGVQNIRKLKFEDIRKKWKTKFVDVFQTLQDAPKPFAVKNKTTPKKFRRFHFPYPIENGVKIVEAEMYNVLTFYNLQASFSNVGDTTRRSGKFIDIISTRTNDGDWKVDQKLLGRWFITELRHVFVADLYTNEMLCSKTYVGPHAKISEGVE